MSKMKPRKGENCILSEQCKLLEEILKKNEDLYYVIKTIHKLNINNLYVAGGCISQSVWNYQSGFDIDYGIEDIDIVYFDDTDLSYEAEDKVMKIIQEEYKHIKYKIDIKNEARVHLWYEDKFGIKIPPYISSESAINSWTPATAIGVNYNDGKFNVYAPFGMNDTFSMTIRPNKTLRRKQTYENKAIKWKGKWNELKIEEWK